MDGFFVVVLPSSWNYQKPSTSKLLYILVYNAFWLAPAGPRRAISIQAGEILPSSIPSPTGRIWASSERIDFVLFRRIGVVMGQPVLRLSSSSRMGEGFATWAQRQTQIHQASRKGRLLFYKQRLAPDPMLSRANGTMGGRKRILHPSEICEPAGRHCLVAGRTRFPDLGQTGFTTTTKQPSHSTLGKKPTDRGSSN